jgi:ribonucleoside-diphosphate reductase alpha chain
MHVHTRLKILKRNGLEIDFEKERIDLALFRAFCDAKELQQGTEEFEQYRKEAEAIATRVEKSLEIEESVHVEEIQDCVEKELMQAGHHETAKSYILFRENKKKARELKKLLEGEEKQQSSFNIATLQQKIEIACKGYEDVCSSSLILKETLAQLYEGATQKEIDSCCIYAAKSKIEQDPSYQYVAARLLLQDIDAEVPFDSFEEYLRYGVKIRRLDPELLAFDVKKISGSLKKERDLLFQYQGLQTLYDRYLIHEKGQRLERPQYFWMRVAMGLCILEKENREERAIQFYDLLSQFFFTSSTPTLFNSGTRHPQLSSCYLSTIDDDLTHIFKVIGDNAQLSKWAGGIGNDWTNIRATGARIQGTNGLTQGIIPFMKVANDTALAVNQGGKRRGSFCAYLEVWHLDIEDFIELRKNTGDERRRTHDMNTAAWIPDLFMKRLLENGVWTLFNPVDVPDLHHLYGKTFEKKYRQYEEAALNGEITQFKRIPAEDLWRKILTMLFETGHPWITFKDPSNIRSSQKHAGVIHSSNLCTEILLNTSTEETAVCNLGSINIANHLINGKLDHDKIAQTVSTGMRMLDNVIDINFYPTKEAEISNMKHRPVGLGMMGFQEALYKLKIPYDSQKAVEFSDEAQECVAYHAIMSSSQLAKERGKYSSYEGSLWSQNLLPQDTIQLLKEFRGEHLDMDTSSTLDWGVVRESVQLYGIRNCNTMAIAPTATIAQITGSSQSIEPAYSHLYVKSNLSGEFCSINAYLVEDLKNLGLWDQQMIDDLKYYDGSIQEIDRIPEKLKVLYKTAFEIEGKWIIDCASRRQKWIDMGQSLNLYLSNPNGKKLSDLYTYAWKKGLKTTYYLRSKSATQVEKSTLDVNVKGIQPRWMKNRSASGNVAISRACQLNDDPSCESCQ